MWHCMNVNIQVFLCSLTRKSGQRFYFKEKNKTFKKQIPIHDNVHCKYILLKTLPWH